MAGRALSRAGEAGHATISGLGGV